MMVGKCAILWGQCNIVEDALRVVRYRDVFLHAWSIYDCSGRMIEDSGFFRAYPDHTSVGGPLTVDPPTASPCLPDGDVFWLGYVVDHFGHFLVGTLARLWALAQHTDGATRIAYVGAAEPDALFRIEHVRLCFEALGIRQEQLLRVEGPLRFPSLTIAEPCFVENFSASPVYGRMMRAIGDHIVGKSIAATPPEADLWLSRTLIASGNRMVVNEAELTDALAGHGIAIEHPERLGFADQIRLWSRVRIGMGFASSAFHTTAFRGGQQLCTLSHDLAASSNQVLIDRVCGNRSLFLHAADGLVDEATTMPGFNARLTILKPVWLAGEIARIADAFRERRISAQTVTPVPRHLWKARSGPAPFGEDMSGQGKVTIRREGARIMQWRIAWKAVRSIGAVTLHDRSGSMEVDALSIEVSGDGVDWATVSSPQSTEARARGDGASLFTYRAAYPQPARMLRIRIHPDRRPDVAEIAVFGERLDAEVGLPDELMHAVLTRRAARGSSAKIVGALASTVGRVGQLISGRSSDRAK